MENRTNKGDLLLAASDEALGHLVKAQQHQARFLDELENSRESFDITFREFNNC